MTSRKDVLKPFEENEDYMESRIKSGVEANRKGECRLVFYGEDGKPLHGVHAEAKQKTHEFKYGANLFMLEEFDKQEQNEAYKKYFAETFNIATLPFYWNTLEPEQGKPRFAKDSPKIYRRPAPDLCLDWCEANKIMPKAHCLNYSSFMPQWAKSYDVNTEKCLLVKRFAELATRYSHRIRDWEVTNETLCGFGLPWKPSFYDSPDLIEWSFKTAERFFPGNRLLINEMHSRIWQNEYFYGPQSPYYLQIENARLKGARIDSVGMQYHMFYRAEQEVEMTHQFYDPHRIYAVMDTYENLGLPLQITELTIPAYSWKADDEEIQAIIIRNLYRMWFSHPAMEAIIYWNLVDGFAHGTTQGDMAHGENYYHGGLVRYDFTPKPAYTIIKDLFETEFHTEISIDSHYEAGDDTERASFTGFYGDYEISATTKDGKTKKFDITHSSLATKNNARSIVLNF